MARLQAGLLGALAVTCLVSIFAAQTALGLAVVVFAVRLLRGDAAPLRTPLDAPILAFCVWTLLSAAFSPDPLASHDSAKKLVLFALLFVAVDSLADGERRARVLDAALLGGLALSAFSIGQYFFLGFDELNSRPRGFLGHYMTASGLEMAVLVTACGRLVGAGEWPRPTRRDLLALGVLLGALGALVAAQQLGLFAVELLRLTVAALAGSGAWLVVRQGSWPGPSARLLLGAACAALGAWALLLSQTRNAWLGALVGLGVVGALRAPRALLLLPVSALLLLLVRPEPVMRRLTATDASSLDRLFMWQAGVDMIRAKPVFGQGPGMILRSYPDYRWPEAPNAQAPHLHDNALQIAAERGLPCLVWWLWLVAAALADTWRESRRGEAASGAALAVLAAVMAAGLFEYNFGDSEVLMFVLLMIALPYAARRQRALVPA